MEQLDFDFADVKSEPLRPRASIHKSGKLGFNSDANEAMALGGGEMFTVAYAYGGPSDTLILFPTQGGDPEKAIARVAKAGEYFYLPLRNFFDRHDVQYDEYRIRFDIEEATVEGREAYILRQRIKNER